VLRRGRPRFRGAARRAHIVRMTDFHPLRAWSRTNKLWATTGTDEFGPIRVHQRRVET